MLQMTTSNSYSPIGVFDSGYGGLTILRQIRQLLPQYDYLYLGDNARAPYGSHSFEVIYQYTLQAVKVLFERGCRLVILACNTASAKALRTIQQRDLPQIDADRRVLGVIRPTVESIGPLTKTRHVGLLATVGTVNSGSYGMEIHKLWPDVQLTGVACPMWVPLVENYEFDSPGADYFVQKQENGDYEPSLQDLAHVQETLQLLSVMTNDHRFEDVYNEASDAQKGEMRNMCEILDKIENRGIEKGNTEGKSQMADLMKILLTENRIEDAKRAAEDLAYCDELMKQYGIG